MMHSEPWTEGWAVCYISLILFQRLWEWPWTAEGEVIRLEPWTEDGTVCYISLVFFKILGVALDCRGRNDTFGAWY